MLEAGNGDIDLIFCGDDIGSQRGLLMSLDAFEANIKPYHLQLNEMIHRHGARVVYHSDGAIMKAIPSLIEMGIDILQPLQFDAEGMDPEVLEGLLWRGVVVRGGSQCPEDLALGYSRRCQGGSEGADSPAGQVRRLHSWGLRT